MHKNSEGEGDFAVAIPDRGILVIEVKEAPSRFGTVSGFRTES